MTPQTRFDRRALLGQLATLATSFAVPGMRSAVALDAARKTGMGLVIYSCSIRRKWLRKQNP